mmetsp:Transcript_53647/g.160617  ORF Transcript_53647/g.160617 Transcript_53647/m.160617 type:complete len:297 (-) Transcript_53647:413-1303(-)
MSSLSYADVPITASGRGSSRSYRSVGGEIDGIDPEKADILSSPEHVDVELDRAAILGGNDDDDDDDVNGDGEGEEDGWDSDVDGMGPVKSSASVWRTVVCRYRFVLAGAAVLVLASMLAGIAIGKTHNGGGDGGDGGDRSNPVVANGHQEASRTHNGPSIPDHGGVEEPHEAHAKVEGSTTTSTTTTTTSTAPYKAQPGVGQPNIEAETASSTPKPPKSLEVGMPSDEVQDAVMSGNDDADAAIFDSFSYRRGQRRYLGMGLQHKKPIKKNRKSTRDHQHQHQEKKKKWRGGGTLE